ncbi:hypothetical protein QYE76_027417 [Lolium multiflorum]|uniref:Integrase catalytic domain-containing protein n=1 Tax=Lolium multiflorum TaxID=4521 RepID=A0AAD8QKR2_LOLMU|nr:hypothetical protein QYE76_027417 [Lolium multiflorum]
MGRRPAGLGAGEQAASAAGGADEAVWAGGEAAQVRRPVGPGSAPGGPVGHRASDRSRAQWPLDTGRMAPVPSPVPDRVGRLPVRAEYEASKLTTNYDVLPDGGRSKLSTPQEFKDATSAVNFIKGVVFGLSVPKSIVTENGSNFTSREFKDYCEGVGIKLQFVSVAHPQTNGQVKKANGLICNGIKKRLLTPLDKARHTWVDELPYVLWSLRTTPNVATEETPFFLVHGAEVVLPIEIENNSPRVVEFEEEAS